MACAELDYFPVLDLNAARQRFMDMSAAELAALGSLGMPVLRGCSSLAPRRAPNPLFHGAATFARLEHTRLAWYARNFLLDAPPTEASPRSRERCRRTSSSSSCAFRMPPAARARRMLHSALRVAQTVNPYLAWDDLDAAVVARAGWALLFRPYDFQRRWLALSARSRRATRHAWPSTPACCSRPRPISAPRRANTCWPRRWPATSQRAIGAAALKSLAGTRRARPQRGYCLVSPACAARTRGRLRARIRRSGGALSEPHGPKHFVARSAHGRYGRTAVEEQMRRPCTSDHAAGRCSSGSVNP